MYSRAGACSVKTGGEDSVWTTSTSCTFPLKETWVRRTSLLWLSQQESSLQLPLLAMVEAHRLESLLDQLYWWYWLNSMKFQWLNISWRNSDIAIFQVKRENTDKLKDQGLVSWLVKYLKNKFFFGEFDV